MAEVFANSEDPDQTPHSAASDLGLHCLPNTLLGVSRLQWVKVLCVKYLALFIAHCLYSLQYIGIILIYNDNIKAETIKIYEKGIC